MTPREVSIEISADSKNRADAFRMVQATGWFGVYYDRVKKWPTLESILRPSEDLTPEEREERQVSKLQRLAEAMGGTIQEIKH